VEFRVLGPLEVTRDGELIDLGAPRQRAVLGFLLLHANQVVPTDRLAEALWPEGTPKTAAKTIQVYVAGLWKALGRARDVIETRGPGYVLRIGPGELDLHRFESLLARARNEEPSTRARTLGEALVLWRGAALADFAYDSFVQPEVARLEELRRHAIEERFQAMLELGGGAELVPELSAIVALHPLEERPRSMLMRALYRAGRQSEALHVFREGRRLLDEGLGLEPGPELVELEGAILRHDPALSANTSPSNALGSLVVVAESRRGWDDGLRLAEALASRPKRREVLLVRVVRPSELAAETAALDELRTSFDSGASVRVAAFSSDVPGDDVVRLGAQMETDLVLVLGSGDPLHGPFGSVFRLATSDVAAFVIGSGSIGAGPVVVPFGAFEHDWAALELGAWVATGLDRPLRLIGAADPGGRGRDASRLLADASLIVQHTAGVVAEPWLGEPGVAGLAGLAADAGLLVVGLSERWRSEGLGATRSALIASPPAPVVLVRRGLRPSGIAPPSALTRFTWSIERSRI
jgi:DNA-binding SARP family transcriptional activator